MKTYNLKYCLSLIFILSLIVSINAQQPTDCSNAIIVCGNEQVNLNPDGFGVQELDNTNSCGSREHDSLWLQITPATNGTLGFILTPSNTNITLDYDFFVFGPNVSCGNIGQAIRCSTTNPQAAGQSNNLTGMIDLSDINDIDEGPGDQPGQTGGGVGDGFVHWLDVLAGDTYFIVIDRAVDPGAFSLEWTGSAQFSDPPIIDSVNNGIDLSLEDCDVTSPFSDGFTTFNLEQNTNAIIGSQTNVTVTYHETESDANINDRALSSPYLNTVNPQPIFFKITDNITGCFEISQFNLNVRLGPDFIEPNNLEDCDNLDDGDAFNGRNFFDLDQRIDDILEDQNANDFTITFHENSLDAENDSSPISSPYHSLNANQEIFVRIEEDSNTDCFSLTSFNLIVNSVPLVLNPTLVQCDEDGIPDGFTTFNLTQANDALTNNDSNLTTTFYRNTFEAENEIFPLNENSFDNWENPQIIYVQVYNTTTMCSSITELTLSVNTLNDLDVSLPEVCDDDGTEDGLHVFNLTETETIVSALLPTNPVISYYEVYEDSLLEQNQITSPNSYMSTNPYTQMVYMRVETQDNECFGISEILLTVYPLPQLLEDETVFYCLNTFPNTITLQSGLIDDNENDYFYSWSSGEDTIDIQVNEPGTYSVLVTNTLGCTKTRTIIVEASDSATFAQPAFTITDTVATHNNTVIVNVTGEGTYEYALYNQDGVYADFQSSATFENVFPGIYTVFVKDTKNDCGTVEKMVSVIGFPKFFSPNGDNTNETWQVYGVSNQFQPNTKIQIFNRAGKLVAQITPLIGGWDGNYNGNPLPSTDYWFAVTLQDGRMFKDHFSLLR